MDFSLNDEQKMLQAGAARFIKEQYSFEKRRALAASPEGFSRDHWAKFAELGWLALPFAEAATDASAGGDEVGGLGGTAIDTMLLMEQFGQGLVLLPYLSTILMAGRAIEAMGSAQQRARFLPPIMAGDLFASLAFVEPQARYDLADVSTAASISGKGWRLSGAKSIVLNGDVADLLVVPARTAGGRTDERGLSCFLVDSKAPGVQIRTVPSTDGGRVSDIVFDDVKLDPEALLGPEDGALPFLSALLDRAAAALCAEAMGIIDAAVEATRAYLLQRSQFGRPLASFQALQHRLSEMVIAQEQTRSLVYVASMRIGEDNPVERARAVSAAKAEISRNGSMILANAVQLHGGMGVSEELNVGTYFKRLHMINALFGDRDYHVRRYAALAA
jgi:alkylation response protein AidB-like acyl-CoA dehydrogenase